jgi:hypothetical protein
VPPQLPHYNQDPEQERTNLYLDNNKNLPSRQV